MAWFEAAYSKNLSAKVRPGKYLLRAYLTEQVGPGQPPDDRNLANNQYPWEPTQYMPVEFEVRAGANEIRCRRAVVCSPAGDVSAGVQSAGRPLTRPGPLPAHM